MIILIGAIVVLGSVLGGFVMAGGRIGTLMHLSELVVIGGAALGALLIMSPKSVLLNLVRQILQSLKGVPYSRQAYEELFMALYELFLIGRRNGMISLEEHVLNPQNSQILAKYPTFFRDEKAVKFLCNCLRPVVDNKVKPDQLRALIEVELDSMAADDHAPPSVLTRAADAMPGFGIVAAVLGIVITMGSIAGPIEQIGEKVAAALVGTFLGIFLSYGFMNPLAVNLEFMNAARHAYARCIAASVVAFASGLAPLTAVEVARRGLSSEIRPEADELEARLKSLSAPAK